MSLQQYVIKHSERNACRCGECLDKGEDKPLSDHTANMIFFDVALKGEVDRDEFLSLIKSHTGSWGDCNPLDGKDHSYIELGGWIGDQGLAMQMMGMGNLLKVWDLLTPFTVLGLDTPKEDAMQLAQMGFLSIQARQ